MFQWEADICVPGIRTSEWGAYRLYVPHPDCLYGLLPQHFLLCVAVAEGEPSFYLVSVESRGQLS